MLLYRSALLLALAGLTASTVAHGADVRTRVSTSSERFSPDGGASERQTLDSASDRQTGTSSVGLDVHYEFPDLGSGEDDPAVWSVTGLAIGGEGLFKAGVTSSLTGVVSSGDGPDLLFVEAVTRYDDTLSVGGDAQFVSFTFSIDGSIESTAETSPNLEVFDQYQHYIQYYQPGFYDTTFTTRLLPVLNGKVDIKMYIAASIQHIVELAAGNGDQSARVDFLHTMRFTGVQGFADKDGTQSSQITSLVGADGFDYGTVADGITALPEPATWATMIAGFGLIGGALRRRSRGVSAALSA